MAWILAAREEPESIAQHVMDVYGNRLSAEMLAEAAETYDPSYLRAGVIVGDGRGSAHATGRYTDAVGPIEAARVQPSTTHVDPETGEPLTELWLQCASFGDAVPRALRSGRDQRSIGITLNQILADGTAGAYIQHLALLTLGEQPRIPAMAPLRAEDFPVIDESAGSPEMQIAASSDVDHGRLITRRLSPVLEAEAAMPDEEKDEAEETAAAEGDSAEATGEDEEDVEAAEGDEDEEEEVEASAKKLTASGQRRRHVAASTLPAEVLSILRRQDRQIAALRKEVVASRKGQEIAAAQAHAQTLVASMPAGLQDDAVKELSAVVDKGARERLAALLVQASGVRTPINLDEVKHGAERIAPERLLAACAQLGVPRDALRDRAILASVAAHAASLPAPVPAAKAVN